MSERVTTVQRIHFAQGYMDVFIVPNTKLVKMDMFTDEGQKVSGLSIGASSAEDIGNALIHFAWVLQGKTT
jgi:hypothetical protein